VAFIKPIALEAFWPQYYVQFCKFFANNEELLTMDKFGAPNLFDRIFSVDIPTREDWFTECVDLVAPDGLVFFTDGTLCEGTAGAGILSYILNVRESYALDSHVIVFQSEVYAILACLEYCISEGIVNRAISICFDSRAALLALKSYAVSSKVVLQCGNSLQELALSNRVRLVWVLGHCCFHGNKEADALVKVGSSFAFEGPEPCLPLAPSCVKRRNGSGSGSGYLNHTAPHGAWRLLVVSRECD
jgi:ribonuclease HI